MNAADQHVIKRARQRYGLELGWDDLAALATLCRDRAGELLLTEDGRGHEQWLVEIHGTRVAAIYDRRDDEVVTLAPWSGNRMFRLAERARFTERGQEVADGFAVLVARVQGSVLRGGGGHAGAA